MKWIVALAVVVGLAPGTMVPATAAGLMDSAPRDGEQLASPPRLVLRFSGGVDRKQCAVTLVGPAKKTILLLRQEPDAPADSIVYRLPALSPGAYQVRWRVSVTGGPPSEGSLGFTVVPGAPPTR